MFSKYWRWKGLVAGGDTDFTHPDSFDVTKSAGLVSWEYRRWYFEGMLLLLWQQYHVCIGCTWPYNSVSRTSTCRVCLEEFGCVIFVYQLCSLADSHPISRDVRGHRQKLRKYSIKLCKNAKNGLKTKEKAEILAQENCQKWGNQLKRGILTPLNKSEIQIITICYLK